MTADQVGSPEREMEVTSQPLVTATLHIRDPEERQSWLGLLGPGCRAEKAIAPRDYYLLCHFSGRRPRKTIRPLRTPTEVVIK